MIYALRHRAPRIFAVVTTVFAAVTVASCGHTEAAPPAVSIEIVMNAVRDYGRGHQSVISPAPASMPDETDEQYRAAINSLFAQENFAELEKIEQQNRKRSPSSLLTITSIGGTRTIFYPSGTGKTVMSRLSARDRRAPPRG
jgi:hypothetical protein